MKRITALLSVIFLLALYVLALIFAILDRPGSENWLMAAIFCTIFIPITMYAWNLMVHFRTRNQNRDDEDSDQ